MILYAMIMSLCATMFGVLAALIYKGKTELIHSYHQTRVTDKAGYGKAFGKAMGVFAAAMILSAIISLFGEDVAWAAVAVLLLGMTAGTIGIVRVQKKYNGGMF